VGYAVCFLSGNLGLLFAAHRPGLSFAIILCACDFNYIRRCDSQPICDTNRACFSSGDFSFAAFSELFGPGQVCYWKTWLSGSNSPCSSASILRSGLRYGPRQ